MKPTRYTPLAVIMNGVIYRRQSGPSAPHARTVRRFGHRYAFEVSPQAGHTPAAAVLRKILDAAGIAYTTTELYLDPSRAAWEGKGQARLGLEVRHDLKTGTDHIIVRLPHRGPYYGGAPVKNAAEAIKLLRELKKDV